MLEFREFLEQLIQNNVFKIIIVMIIFDTVFGVLRAIRERKLNSCVGIDGMIRKARNVIFKFLLFSNWRITEF